MHDAAANRVGRDAPPGAEQFIWLLPHGKGAARSGAARDVARGGPASKGSPASTGAMATRVIRDGASNRDGGAAREHTARHPATSSMRGKSIRDHGGKWSVEGGSCEKVLVGECAPVGSCDVGLDCRDALFRCGECALRADRSPHSRRAQQQQTPQQQWQSRQQEQAAAPLQLALVRATPRLGPPVECGRATQCGHAKRPGLAPLKSGVVPDVRVFERPAARSGNGKAAAMRQHTTAPPAAVAARRRKEDGASAGASARLPRRGRARRKSQGGRPRVRADCGDAGRLLPRRG